MVILHLTACNGGSSRLFLSLALAAGPAFLATSQHSSAQDTYGEEAKIHDRGGHFLHLRQDRTFIGPLIADCSSP